MKIVTDWNQFKNFSREEFECPCCGVANMSLVYMDKIQQMRSLINRPMTVTSGFRCDAYNRSVGGSPRHPSGRAGDYMVAPDAYRTVLKHALLHFAGVGIRAHGPRWERFIHIDDYQTGFWTYQAREFPAAVKTTAIV